MSDTRWWPLYDDELSHRGVVRVGADGQLIIELSGGGSCGLVVSDSVELARLVLRRGKPTHSLVETETLSDSIHRLEEMLREDDER